MLRSSVDAGYITQAEYDRVLDREHPMTFDTYVDIASKLTIKDTDGKVRQYGTNTIPVSSYVWSKGSDYIKDDKYFNADDKAMIEAYQLAADICNPSSSKYCTPSYEDIQSVDSNTLFMSGKTAMIYAGRWYAASYEDTTFNWACVPLPVAEEGQDAISYCGSVLYGIAHSSKNNQMSWKVLKFLASKEAYRIMNKLNYAVPARKSLITEEEFKDPISAGVSKKMTAADAAVFFKIAENAHIHPAYYFTSNRWINILTQNETYIYSGEKTAQQMLKDAEMDINAAIKAANPELFK